jgi:hypothetical protein
MSTFLVTAYLPDFLKWTELWAFGVLSCNHYLCVKHQTLTGADTWLDSVRQYKMSGLECLSTSLAKPTMENVYYISNWRV